MRNIRVKVFKASFHRRPINQSLVNLLENDQFQRRIFNFEAFPFTFVGEMAIVGEWNSHFSNILFQNSPIFSSSKWTFYIGCLCMVFGLSCIFSVSIFAALHILNACFSHLSRIFYFAMLVSIRTILCIYGNPKCNNFWAPFSIFLAFLLQNCSLSLSLTHSAINACDNLCVRTRPPTFPYHIAQFGLFSPSLSLSSSIINLCTVRYILLAMRT